MAAGGAAHADVELMSSLTEKISLLEQKVEKQEQEIQLKDGRIAELQEKIKILQEGEDASGSPPREELEMRCLQLQSQVWEMERFLNDYGLVWVGEARHQLGDTASLQEEEELPAGNLCEPGEAVVCKRQIDFDLILENVKDLNSLVGEGISQIEHTARGARLRQPEPLPLTLYRNGIVVGHGAFRPYQHPATQTFLHGHSSTNRSSPAERSVPSSTARLRCDHELSCSFSNACRTSWMGISPQSCSHATPTVSPCRSLTGGTWCFRSQTFPGAFLALARWWVLQNPTRCRKPPRSQVPKPPGSRFPTSFPSPCSTEGEWAVPEAWPEQRHRVKPAEEAGAPAPDRCTLRVRSESGEQTYELRLLLTDTIGDLRRHLAHIRGGNSDYEIISTFPQRVYTDSSRSLQECGLVPRASLLLRRRDPSRQEGRGLQTA
ncbi:UBX domain-containing protein 11 [Anomalospiza imberbis]|uniref:UBX domain-containing protein 11 n=1 Tax=Anomalospiza imberbis TaxID=187417 RepID=UPI00358F5D29